MSGITIKIEGLDKLREAFAQFPKKTVQYLNAAGREAGKRIILPTEGLKKYPPATDANRPPTPYYIRGRGTQYAGGNKGNSERYGTQFYVDPQGSYTDIGNRASYAQYLADAELQAKAMQKKGWRTLLSVAEEKIKDITEVYDLWIKKLLTDL